MTKQVEIKNRDGHILRGIVNIPEDGTRFPAIVNVHGFTGNKSGYKSIYTHTARFLSEHGFASVRFDLYGNGESDGEFEDMTFTGILHDIEDIINWTKTQDFANPDKIILSGQSMGVYHIQRAAFHLLDQLLRLAYRDMDGKVDNAVGYFVAATIEHFFSVIFPRIAAPKVDTIIPAVAV